MKDWTIWATFLAMGNALALLAIYLLCRTKIEQSRSRLSVLERELALAHMREQANERKLQKIFEAVMELRDATDDQFGHLRARIDQLLDQTISHRDRSAA
ncbi:MAG TPA: hypothetical protein VE131_05660 [Terriglobales bacterium]|nr:hypothetical protein [Terriglobales bacterium]